MMELAPAAAAACHGASASTPIIVLDSACASMSGIGATTSGIGLGTALLTGSPMVAAAGCAAVGLAAGCLLSRKRRRTNDDSYAVSPVLNVVELLDRIGKLEACVETVQAEHKATKLELAALQAAVDDTHLVQTESTRRLAQAVDRKIDTTQLQALQAIMETKADAEVVRVLQAAVDEKALLQMSSKNDLVAEVVESFGVQSDTISELMRTLNQKADAAQLDALQAIVEMKADADVVPSAYQHALDLKADAAVVLTTAQFEELQTAVSRKADADAVPPLANPDRIYSAAGNLQCCISDSGQLGIWRLSDGSFVRWVCDHPLNGSGAAQVTSCTGFDSNRGVHTV